MRLQRWQVRTAALLLGSAAAFYGLRWLLFPAYHDEMLRYLVDDLAFLFLQVLLVTVVLDRALQKRAKDELRRKLNMVVGAFFSQTGADLLARIASADTHLAEVRDELIARPAWTPEQFAAARQAFLRHDPAMSLDACDLTGLRETLNQQRPHLLSLLSNQSLLEHETFTDLLWAITHLAEELSARQDLGSLDEPDRLHLQGDAKRAYVLLGAQWIDYLAHLKAEYPYLFSLAVRTNPLDPAARAEVSE